MRKIIIIPVLAGTLLGFVSALLLTAGPTPDHSAVRLYKGTIDKYIITCNLKERLFKNSRFENVRKSSALARKQATFFSANKERLAADMLKEKIAKKHHHIEAYLNQRFLDGVPQDRRVADRTATGHQ